MVANEEHFIASLYSLVFHFIYFLAFFFLSSYVLRVTQRPLFPRWLLSRPQQSETKEIIMIIIWRIDENDDVPMGASSISTDLT